MRPVLYRWLLALLFAGLAHAQSSPTPAVTTSTDKSSSAPAPAKVSAPAPAKTPAPALSKVDGPLRIAIDPHNPPLIYKTGDKVSGLEADFARGLGAALGRPVTFVETPENNLIPALLDDKADVIMSGFAISQLRQVRVAFCSPYLRIGQVALCRRSDLSSYANNANLENMRDTVGVVSGSTGDVLVGTQFGYATRKPYPALPDAVYALLAHDVNMVITDYPTALWQSSANEATVAVIPNLLTQDDIAWAVRKDDDDLRAAANAYLEKLRNTHALEDLVRKWIPDASSDSIAPASTPPPAAASTPAASTGEKIIRAH